MQGNKAKDTKPELVVRRLLHRDGYRFRLHRRDLPGCPDIVFGARRKIVEVKGCFWHSHGCGAGSAPKSNQSYWTPKLAANVARDRANLLTLAGLGWEVLEVWQCELADIDALATRLTTFLGPRRTGSAGAGTQSELAKANDSIFNGAADPAELCPLERGGLR